MKIRHILPNDRPETIAKYQELMLEANPGCTLEGININPLKKNQQREGEFEVDFILSLPEEKQIETQVLQATAQLQDLVTQKDLQIEKLKSDTSKTKEKLNV